MCMLIFDTKCLLADSKVFSSKFSNEQWTHLLYKILVSDIDPLCLDRGGDWRQRGAPAQKKNTKS